jgi:hypothetical protein
MTVQKTTTKGPPATSNPENTFQYGESDYNPLLIADFRVLAWQIYQKAEEVLEYVDTKTYHTWVKASWSLILNRGPSMLPFGDFTVIVVDDNKHPQEQYWRTVELQKFWADVPEDELPLAKKRPKVRYTHEGLIYKGGRKPKPEEWKSVAQIGLEYVTDPKKRYFYFTEPYYEADDWAGGVVYLKRLAQSHPEEIPEMQPIRDREVFLLTVDTDWMQLAGNGVWWCNTGPWLPRLRGEKEAREYVHRKFKRLTDYAHEIVDVKMELGDKSDNLPEGSPRWAIDLINSHPEWHIRNHPTFKQFTHAVNSETRNRDHGGYDKARRWCLARGLPIVVPHSFF